MEKSIRRKHETAVAFPKQLPGGWLLLAGFGILLVMVLATWALSHPADVSGPAPEADRVLAAQASIPFQILIPAYMPREFDRAGVNIQNTETGPGGEPMVQLAYQTASNARVYLREWVPVNAEKEILATSRPIQTKWGQGWLLVEVDALNALWVDVGPTRISIYTRDVNLITKEQILEMAETLGPASNQQVFSFVINQPQVQAIQPPAPTVIPINAQGVQELTLVVTPGGYTPLRFSVQKGVPVRLTFRQLGQVGCGNELIFPSDPQNPASLHLESDQDQKVLEFTPQQVGEFEFHCSHQMYRGIMTVRN